MQLQFSRLRSGEWIAGASAITLLVVMLSLRWYSSHSHEITGWRALSHLRWLVVVTIAAALALAWFQAACRAPALPATFSVTATVLAALTALALIYRVLISVPGSSLAGAYIGLITSFALTFGAFRSLRTEDRPDPVANAAIPIVTLEQEG